MTYVVHLPQKEVIHETSTVLPRLSIAQANSTSCKLLIPTKRVVVHLKQCNTE